MNFIWSGCEDSNDVKVRESYIIINFIIFVFSSHIILFVCSLVIYTRESNFMAKIYNDQFSQSWLLTIEEITITCK